MGIINWLLSGHNHLAREINHKLRVNQNGSVGDAANQRVIDDTSIDVVVNNLIILIPDFGCAGVGFYGLNFRRLKDRTLNSFKV